VFRLLALEQRRCGIDLCLGVAREKGRECGHDGAVVSTASSSRRRARRVPPPGGRGALGGSSVPHLRCYRTTELAEIRGLPESSARIGAPVFVAFGQYDYARLLHRRGGQRRRAMAERLLDEAFSTARLLELPRVGRDVERLLGGLR